MNLHKMITSGYIPYMLEAEGYDKLINTREAKLNGIIREMRDRRYEDVTLEEVLKNHGISRDSLTYNELMKIVEGYSR